MSSLDDIIDKIENININKEEEEEIIKYDLRKETNKIIHILNNWLSNNKIGSNTGKREKISQEMFWCIINNNINIDDIKNMINHINNNKYVFTNGSLWDSLSNYFNNEKYFKFFKEIFELTPTGLNTSPNACCGKGELLYRLLRPKSIQPKKGDIIDNNEKIELKGKEIRISSSDINGKQYIKIINNIFSSYIKGKEIKKGGLKGSINCEIEKTQYESHYIEEFSKIDTEKTIKLFENLLDKLNIEGNHLELSKKICKNGFNQEEYQRILLIDFFIKYKKKMKFDKLIILGDGNNVKIIKNVEDLSILKIYADYFRINQSLCIGWYVK